MSLKNKILVLCTGNSCRSQMAEAYLRYFGGTNIEVSSAGIETHGLNPRAVKVMLEDGIDISHQTSNHVDEYKDIQFVYLITVCDHAAESCPNYFPLSKKFHWSLKDPAKAQGTEEEILVEFRKTRDKIKELSENWMKSNIMNS